MNRNNILILLGSMAYKEDASSNTYIFGDDTITKTYIQSLSNVNMKYPFFNNKSMRARISHSVGQKGYNDRDLVKEICGMDIYIDAKDLPKLEDGEFYWSQLEGLKVITKEGVLLGKVSQLMETGANDVLVVRGCEGSYDREERLIPYVPDQFVLNIDLDKQEMVVDWDPDF